MEKTAELQYRIYNEKGHLKMRHPGGKITPYCGEHGYMDHLVNDGDEAIITKVEV